MLRKALTTIFVLFATSPLYAESDMLNFNIFNIQVEVNTEIDNNQMQVILASEHQEEDIKKLAEVINKDMQWALEQVKKDSSLKPRTLNYTTYPVYKEQKLIAWRGSQQLEIKSTALDELNTLLGKLQERLILKSMNFMPTDASVKQAQKSLLNQGLAEFKQQADHIREQMGAKAYKIVQANIGTAQPPMPIPYFRSEVNMRAQAMADGPAVAAGTNQTSLMINGSIQLQY